MASLLIRGSARASLFVIVALVQMPQSKLPYSFELVPSTWTVVASSPHKTGTLILLRSARHVNDDGRLAAVGGGFDLMAARARAGTQSPFVGGVQQSSRHLV